MLGELVDSPARRLCLESETDPRPCGAVSSRRVSNNCSASRTPCSAAVAGPARSGCDQRIASALKPLGAGRGFLGKRHAPPLGFAGDLAAGQAEELEQAMPSPAPSSRASDPPPGWRAVDGQPHRRLRRPRETGPTTVRAPRPLRPRAPTSTASGSPIACNSKRAISSWSVESRTTQQL